MATSLHRVTSIRMYFIPVQTRVPLKFGSETLTSATCLRVAMRVVDEAGRFTEGWGETPLSVQWVWPSQKPYVLRHDCLKRFCKEVALAWNKFDLIGHALEAGHEFQEEVLPTVFSKFNRSESAVSQTEETMGKESADPMPWLAALVCNSAFDLALHDAYGRLAQLPVYQTYGREFLKQDLSHYLEPAAGAAVDFKERFPTDYLAKQPAHELMAWHLVGGLDPLDQADLTGAEPNDGYPLLLRDWIQRDGLKCLKIKLRGNDEQWDYARVIKVGQIGMPEGVEWLTADFNCTVEHPDYVNHILDRVLADFPKIHERILYVEQPFPYDLERHQIDVHSVSNRKLLFLDESAHDWRMIRLGHKLGWTGVALKTCKTQTGAILSACWARAHGMDLMVQDLTNPMLAQIPHLLLAANVGTIMGVETNAMQFYPEASAPEAKVHPGLYTRRGGVVNLASIKGPGFGYRVGEINRQLPDPEFVPGEAP